jgi:hypothetical protein
VLQDTVKNYFVSASNLVLQHKIQYIYQDTIGNYSISASSLVPTAKETSLTILRPDIAALLMILTSTF